MDFLLPVIVFAIIGALAGVLLTVASKVFEVKTDERLEKLQESLPQVNCGACGFSGCNDYAEAVLNGETCNLCKPGGAEAAKKLSQIMGVESGEVVELTAFVKCKGDCNSAAHKYVYDGEQTCKASNRYYNGSKLCTSGCLGYGDCVKVCEKSAVCIVDSIAVINSDQCMGCGLCAKACPNNLIVLRPKTQKVDVACSSTAMGKVTRAVCKSGCIGCKMCEKKCPFGAITVENNFASIDYSKCKNCGICAEACKMGAITIDGNISG